jgi:hypothetical protein
MKKRFPGFTVLIERVLRLSCVLGVAALAAACGGGQTEDGSADDATTMSVQGNVSAGTRTRVPATTDARTNGIVLSEKGTNVRNGIILTEKYSRPISVPGIVLSEKAQAPADDGAVEADTDEQSE